MGELASISEDSRRVGTRRPADLVTGEEQSLDVRHMLL